LFVPLPSLYGGGYVGVLPSFAAATQQNNDPLAAMFDAHRESRVVIPGFGRFLCRFCAAAKIPVFRGKNGARCRV
jgi:hypothetical protein